MIKKSLILFQFFVVFFVFIERGPWKEREVVVVCGSEGFLKGKRVRKTETRKGLCVFLMKKKMCVVLDQKCTLTTVFGLKAMQCFRPLRAH